MRTPALQGLPIKRITMTIAVVLATTIWHGRADAEDMDWCGSFTADKDAPERLREQGMFLRLAICGDGASPSDFWWMDDDLSEIARVAYLSTCLRPDPKDGRFDNDDVATVVGLCVADMQRVDKAKYEAEAATRAGDNEYGKTAFAEMWTKMDARRTTWTAHLDALAKKDEDWKKLMGAAVAGFDRWYADYAKHKDALERARKFTEILEGDNPKLAKGCAATMRKDLVDYLASKKPKSDVDVKSAMTDSIGYHLTLALARCDGADKLWIEGYALFEKPGLDHQRGPRWAQRAATHTVLAEIKNERPKFPINVMGNVSSPGIDTIKAEARGDILGSVRDGQGVVDKLKPGKAGIAVTFKVKKYKQIDRVCEDTGRIYKIYGDGTVSYHQTCKVTGSHMVTEKTDPITVPKELAGQLKAGLYVEFLANRFETPSTGIPMRIYKDADKEKLLSYLWLKL